MKEKIKKIITTTLLSAMSISAIGCSATGSRLARKIDKSMAAFVTSINNLDYVSTTKSTSENVGKIVETSANAYETNKRQISSAGNKIMFLSDDVSEAEIENTITRPESRSESKLFILSDTPFVSFTSDNTNANFLLSVKFSTDKIEDTSSEIDEKINTLILKRSILMIYVNEIYNGNVTLSGEDKTAINAYVNVIKENTSFLNGNRGMVKNQLKLASDLLEDSSNENLVNYYIIKSGEALETRLNKLDSTISAIDSITTIIEDNLTENSNYFDLKLSSSYSDIIANLTSFDDNGEESEIQAESTNEEIAKSITNSLDFFIPLHNKPLGHHHVQPRPRPITIQEETQDIDDNLQSITDEENVQNDDETQNIQNVEIDSENSISRLNSVQNAKTQTNEANKNLSNQTATTTNRNQTPTTTNQIITDRSLNNQVQQPQAIQNIPSQNGTNNTTKMDNEPAINKTYITNQNRNSITNPSTTTNSQNTMESRTTTNSQNTMEPRTTTNSQNVTEPRTTYPAIRNNIQKNQNGTTNNNINKNNTTNNISNKPITLEENNIKTQNLDQNTQNIMSRNLVNQGTSKDNLNNQIKNEQSTINGSINKIQPRTNQTNNINQGKQNQISTQQKNAILSENNMKNMQNIAKNTKNLNEAQNSNTASINNNVVGPNQNNNTLNKLNSHTNNSSFKNNVTQSGEASALTNEQATKTEQNKIYPASLPNNVRPVRVPYKGEMVATR